MLRHLIVVLAFAAGAAASDAQARRKEASARPTDPVRDKVVATLANLRVTLEFEQTSLEEAIEFIRQFTKLNILIDSTVRERYAKGELKITMKVKDLPLGSALKLMLETRGHTMLYKDQVLLVVTEDRANESAFLHVYDVRDLLMKINHFPGPEISLSPIQGVTPDFPEPPDGEITPEYVVDAIRRTCGRTSWDENPKTSIEANNGLLIVTQTEDVHKQIKKLLRMLRANK